MRLRRNTLQFGVRNATEATFALLRKHLFARAKIRAFCAVSGVPDARCNGPHQPQIMDLVRRGLLVDQLGCVAKRGQCEKMSRKVAVACRRAGAPHILIDLRRSLRQLGVNEVDIRGAELGEAHEECGAGVHVGSLGGTSPRLPRLISDAFVIPFVPRREATAASTLKLCAAGIVLDHRFYAEARPQRQLLPGRI
jgi:hypothetical protein